jgi:hypothetical protein
MYPVLYVVAFVMIYVKKLEHNKKFPNWHLLAKTLSQLNDCVGYIKYSLRRILVLSNDKVITATTLFT